MNKFVIEYFFQVSNNSDDEEIKCFPHRQLQLFLLVEGTHLFEQTFILIICFSYEPRLIIHRFEKHVDILRNKS